METQTGFALSLDAVPGEGTHRRQAQRAGVESHVGIALRLAAWESIAPQQESRHATLLIPMRNSKIRVTLISPYFDITASGLRIISSHLKTHGHDVRMIFVNASSDGFAFPEDLVKDLVSLCESSELIGFSLMTNHFLMVKELTIRLKERFATPIIWGGIHPTVAPEECLEYADMVCIGEGEDAMLELANSLAAGEDITGIDNIWVKQNTHIFRNEVRDLEENLDKYPFQDYDIDTHHILRDGRIVKMTEELLEKSMRAKYSCVEYEVMTTRGCPHSCTYCCNNALKRIYARKGKFIRKRSPESVIREIEGITKRFRFIKQVWLMDDTFFIRTREEIQAFCKVYKERVNLPLRCEVSPLTLAEEKLRPMIDAGLFNINMGIESCSDETLLDCYKRPIPRRVIGEAVRILEKYRSQLPYPVYDIIVDNPYETKASRKETLQFVMSLPEGVRVVPYSLVFYPGTELYDRAMQDGLIKNRTDDLYLNYWTGAIRSTDYISAILSLHIEATNRSHGRKSFAKKVLLKMLSSDEIILLLDNKMTSFVIWMCMRIRSAWAMTGRRLLRERSSSSGRRGRQEIHVRSV